MARWIRLAAGPGEPTHRCVVHAYEFSAPATCPHCDGAPASEEESATGDLPYIPGLPTPVEDEREFRGLSRQFLEAAQKSDVATVAVKYAELGLRALTVASAMGERRVSAYIAEKRQAEVRAIGAAAPRAKKK